MWAEKKAIDGFKFDSGDTYLYRNDDCTYIRQEPNLHTKAFNRFCGQFIFNELRNVWDCGGMPLVCRLQDKLPTWDNGGLLSLIPNMLAQGILGYYFGCPDMIGGGNYGAFLNKDYHTDEDLYLRWLAVSLLCPMMQFSISPKRVLSKKSYEIVRELSKIREIYVGSIIDLAQKATKTGEPILRYMEYEFPNCGYEKITDQFMLGKNILVAPILAKGSTERCIQIPEGTWSDSYNNLYIGPTEIKYKAGLNELPIFVR